MSSEYNRCLPFMAYTYVMDQCNHLQSSLVGGVARRFKYKLRDNICTDNSSQTQYKDDKHHGATKKIIIKKIIEMSLIIKSVDLANNINGKLTGTLKQIHSPAELITFFSQKTKPLFTQ